MYQARRRQEEEPLPRLESLCRLHREEKIRKRKSAPSRRHRPDFTSEGRRRRDGAPGQRESLCGTHREEKRRAEEEKRQEGKGRDVFCSKNQKLSTEREEEKKLNETVRVSRLHPSRYISGSVRERVLERAGYQCEFTGTGGVRCTARAGLEIDHIKPYAKAGAPGAENLRALCQAHNLFSAAREFGAEFMRVKIEERTTLRAKTTFPSSLHSSARRRA